MMIENQVIMVNSGHLSFTLVFIISPTLLGWHLLSPSIACTLLSFYEENIVLVNNVTLKDVDI